MTDLHVHSTCSDGTLTPTQLVDYAIEKNLTSFALTDHDSVDGLDEAINYAEALRGQSEGEAAERSGESQEQNPDGAAEHAPAVVPEVVPGVELSTEYQGSDIHIVGLFINYKDAAFQAYLRQFVESRDLRNRKMCALLRGAGIDISYESLTDAFPGSVITRAHYAKYMLEHGCVKSMKEAFDRYIGDHCPCYVPREKVTPAQAVELILGADGVPILAHPITYGMSDERLDKLTAELKAVGLMGIEALYSTYTAADERQIRKLAEKHHLLISGGSDFHGTNKPGLDMATGYGSLRVPDLVLEDIRATRKNLLFTDLDGTLLQNDSTVSRETRDALDRMARAGHRLILSSGRPLPSILEVREKEHIAYPNMLIIANNGAQVYDCDKKRYLLERRVCREDIRYIEEAAAAVGLHIHSYTADEIVCASYDAETKFYTRRIHMPVKCVESLADTLPQGCCKMLAIHLTDKELLERFRDSLADYCSDRIQMVFSNDCYLEILPAQAGKGSALRYIADYLHVPLSHTFAAGDAENDISMLEAAGTGIAMANAPENVKNAARIVTGKSNDENGLLEILDRFFA